MNNLKADSIDATSIVPLYKQVSQILTEEIKNGNLAVGEKIPSELSLMEIFNVSRVTVRGAIAELVEDGLLVRSQGKGTYVAPQKQMQMANDLPGLTNSCKQAGKTLTSKILSIEYAYPTHSESKFLKIPENEQVIEIRRLRYIDGHPTIIETAHFLKEYDFLFQEDLTGSLFEILRKHGITVTNSTRTMEICSANAYEAGLLELKRNSSLLLFKDHQFDNSSKPFYVSKQLYNTQNMVFYL